ncbi:MAG: putative permease [Bermanella sp.]|uniref:AEC family transporter n=1 Tax=Glaciecola sp. 33A TaxID=2057807 RepID=UPI000C3258F6|nr:AEC family transporter [Glaciecola sp. 33A]PKI00144.1 AEC family transporter [Glaciecola sp. 33A]
MLNISLSILPVFLLLLFGALLQTKRFPAEDFWPGVDKLVYWVLFPSMLFYNISKADLSSSVLPSYTLILGLSLFTVSVLALIISLMNRVDRPTGTSILQASIRFNSFIALALASTIYGEEGLILATLGAAILIPCVNVVLVITMVSLHGNKNGKSLSSLLIKELFKNPLILSIAAGVVVNLTDIGEFVILLTDITGILARATLPLVLLAVGASLRLQALKSSPRLLVLSTLTRLVGFPLCIGIGCTILGVGPLEACVAILFGAVPTATSGYALAKQLGGNASILSVFISVQTGLTLLTLPVTVWFSQIWFGYNLLLN